MRLINKVTVTGADDSTEIKDLLKLAKEFPFVEYGILMSKGSFSGKNRMPSFDWIDDFVDEFKGKGVAISGHICGSWVKQIYSGNWPSTEIHHGFSIGNSESRHAIGRVKAISSGNLIADIDFRLRAYRSKPFDLKTRIVNNRRLDR